jgi:hypothetical protein
MRRGIAVKGHASDHHDLLMARPMAPGLEAGSWWPEWICIADLDARHPRQGPARPSLPVLARQDRPRRAARQHRRGRPAQPEPTKTRSPGASRPLSKPGSPTLRCHGRPGCTRPRCGRRDAITPATRRTKPPGRRPGGDQRPVTARGSRKAPPDGPAPPSDAHDTLHHPGWDACLLIS